MEKCLRRQRRRHYRSRILFTCERPFLPRLLGLLFRRRRCTRTTHAVATHHAGPHRFHVLLHPLHVGNQRLPHIDVILPACLLRRVLDRRHIRLHLSERGFHLLHVGVHGLHLLFMHLHHFFAMLGPHLISSAGPGRCLWRFLLCPHQGRHSEYQDEQHTLQFHRNSPLGTTDTTSIVACGRVKAKPYASISSRKAC